MRDSLDKNYLDNHIATMYIAQIPPTNQHPVPPKATWGEGVPPKESWVGMIPTLTMTVTQNFEAEQLLTAIFNLKGETAEIYKLKALAFEIKAKLHVEQQGT